MKFYILFAGVVGSFIVIQGQNIRLREALLRSGDYLNDVDGDNIPGQAGLDYPVHASVPEGTSFRCSDYDYAGYFGDVEAGCQAYHVCFPDGRNASFLCVNGTIFHQRFFVCDWWFHFECGKAPNMYELNLYRKIPLPVLPPVQRKPFVRPTNPPPNSLPGPIPQPRSNLVSQNPNPSPRNPKRLDIDNPKTDRTQGKDKNKWNKDREPPNSGRTFTNSSLSVGIKMNDQCYCDCPANQPENHLSPAVIYL